MIVRLVIKSNQFNHLLHRKSPSGEGFASHNLRIIEQLFNHSSAHIISYKHLCLAWPGPAEDIHPPEHFQTRSHPVLQLVACFMLRLQCSTSHHPTPPLQSFNLTTGREKKTRGKKEQIERYKSLHNIC